MFSRKKSKPVNGNRIDRFLDSMAAQEQSWKKAKPFFPSLTKFLLILGLGFLSWLATYTGMLELIQANSGYLDFSYKIAIAFAVAMLMLMIIYILDALFSPLRWWLRLMYVAGYVFLTLISVGFGFGFYWKFLESRAEATRSAESALGQVQTALQAGQTRLEQLQTTLTSLTVLSSQKAEQERTKGRTCPASPPGDGPRRRMRDADASNFRFAGNFVSQRVEIVKGDIESLNADMAKVVTGEKSTIDPKTGTRNAFLRGLSRKLDLTTTRFNAFRTDPQLLQFRDTFAKRSEQTVFDDGRGGKFRCPDPQLQIALRGVVKAIDGLPELDRPAVTAVEGSEAIVEAFRRMTASTFGLLTLKLPPTPDELRALQHKAVQSVRNTPSRNPILQQKAGLGERDYIPLFVAIFVDLCILLVSVNRPVNRLQGFINAAREARDAQMHEVLNRFHQVHKGERSQRLDIFHDAMFDWNGDHYVAVPLDLRTVEDGDERKKKAIQARYLSTLMATLEEAGLVRRSVIVGANTARRKLIELSSPFAESPSFRVYRFSKGAWPAIVLDDILGASDKLIAEQTAEAHRQAVHDLFSPQSAARPEPDLSDLPRPEFPRTAPGEKETSADIDASSSPYWQKDYAAPPEAGSKATPEAQRQDADDMSSGHGQPTGSRKQNGHPKTSGKFGASKGAQTPNVIALDDLTATPDAHGHSYSGNGHDAAMTDLEPESRPERRDWPELHPLILSAAEINSDGAFDQNENAPHARNQTEAEGVEILEPDIIDDNQQRLPFEDDGSPFTESRSVAAIIIAETTSGPRTNGQANDIMNAPAETPEEMGSAADESGTTVLDQKIVDDLTEAMVIETMPPDAPNLKAATSVAISGTAEDLPPEPPRHPDRQRLIAISKRDDAHSERTANISPEPVEITPRSGEDDSGAKTRTQSKPGTEGRKLFRGWKENLIDNRSNEDPDLGWRQPKMDIGKIARRFSPEGSSNGKTRNGKSRQ